MRWVAVGVLAGWLVTVVWGEAAAWLTRTELMTHYGAPVAFCIGIVMGLPVRESRESRESRK